MYHALDWRRFKFNILAFRIRELPAYALDHTWGDNNTYLPAKKTCRPSTWNGCQKAEDIIVHVYTWPRLSWSACFLVLFWCVPLCFLFYFVISVWFLPMSCQVSLLCDYCFLPLCVSAVPCCVPCVWYLSPCLSFVPCQIIVVCGELCPVCYLCSRSSLCYSCYLRHLLPFTWTVCYWVLPACLPPANRDKGWTLYSV